MLVFEVGRLHKVKGSNAHAVDTATATPIAVWGLPVNPQSISWDNSPRDSVIQAPGGSLHVKADRAVAHCTVQGTFGLEGRILGIVTGTGPEMRYRFENEVIDLSSASSDAFMDDVIRRASLGITGVTQEGIKFGNVLAKKLADFDASTDAMYVNVYDLFFRRYHRIGEMTFRPSLSSRGGGAVGMGPYTLTFTAYGPPIVSTESKVDRAAAIALEGMAQWQQATSLLKSTTATELLRQIRTLTSFSTLQVAASLDAIASQALAAQALVTGTLTSGSSAFFGFVGGAVELSNAFDDLARAFSTATYGAPVGSYAPQASQAEVDWTSVDDDPALVAFDSTVSSLNISEALQFQRIAGRWFGMDDTEYRSFLEAGGTLGGRAPDVKRTIRHQLASYDTPDDIAARYGVTWVEVVRLNRKTFPEMRVGDIVEIPVIRPWGAPTSISVPTLGSHVGEGVLGYDLTLPLQANADTDLATVYGRDCYVQGCDLLRSQVETAALEGLDGLPDDAIAAVVSERIRLALMADKRTRNAVVDVTPGESMRINVNLRSIIQ